MEGYVFKLMNVPTRFFYEGEGGGGGTGGDGGAGAGAGDSGSGGGDGSGSADKTFTQAELNAKAGEVRAESRKAAEKQLAESLGVSIDEAKGIIKAHNERVEGEKSEAQKATDKAKADSEAADVKVAEANQRIHEANLRDALRDAGVAKDKVARLSSLLNDVEVGADEAVIVSKVGELKKEFPELFGEEAGGAPNSDPGSGPKGKQLSESGMAKGAERFKNQGSQQATYPILEQQKS